MKYSFFAALVLLVSLNSCKKGNSDLIKIEGFALTDVNGNPLSPIGDASDDWKLYDWDDFSATEQGFLNFADNVTLNGTVLATISHPIAYPNPLHSLSSIAFHATDTVKVKIAIVGSDGTVYRTYSQKFKGAFATMIDFSSVGPTEGAISLRYYYSFSAAGNENFKVGHGDIRICRIPDAQFIEDCFY